MCSGQEAPVAPCTMRVGGLDTAAAGRAVAVGAPILGGAGGARVTVQIGVGHPPLAGGAVAVALRFWQGHQSGYTRD